MKYKTFALFLIWIFVITGCDVNMESQNAPAAAPEFVTATLPATAAPLATQTPLPPTYVPTIEPIEGTATTQINVRAETSSASENLGMIVQFSPLQIIGKDASGSWYQIIYTASQTGTGWVRAEYVQVNSSAEIPVVELGTGSGAGVSGLVIQKVNVRNGPGTTYESLGTLNPNDVVFMIGKDPGGTWIQIEYTSASDGKGWVSSEFLKMGATDQLVVIGDTAPTSQTSANVPAVVISSAIQDGDSITAPLAKVTLASTGSRAFQINGEVSAPEGDMEDWVEFNSDAAAVAIQVLCASNDLKVVLWNNGAIINDFLLSCGEERVLRVAPNSMYIMQLSYLSVKESQHTKYTVMVKAVY